MLGQFGNGVFLELGDAHPAVARLHLLRFDALYLDDFANQGNLDRLHLTLAQDGNPDRGLRLAAHFLDGLR